MVSLTQIHVRYKFNRESLAFKVALVPLQYSVAYPGGGVKYSFPEVTIPQ